jgi:hypothetical protein
VEEKDNIRVPQTGMEEFMIHQFRNFVGSATSKEFECELQSTLAPTSSTVYLQIYNYDTNSWETIDSDSTTASDTDFVLTATVADLTNYKDPSNLTTARVYQEAL